MRPALLGALSAPFFVAACFVAALFVAALFVAGLLIAMTIAQLSSASSVFAAMRSCLSKTFGEGGVNRGQEIARLRCAAALAQQPCQTGGRPQFGGPVRLPRRHRQGLPVCRF